MFEFNFTSITRHVYVISFQGYGKIPLGVKILKRAGLLSTITLNKKKYKSFYTI